MADEMTDTIPLYQVDAFTDVPFRGNPAAVCLYEEWLDESVMQAIAAENNLSETAFLVPHDDDWALRWFTPEVEVDLCGHATLASALVLFTEIQPERDEIRFHTKSGELYVRREDDWIVLDLPTRLAVPTPGVPPALARGLGRAPVKLLTAGDTYLAVFDGESDVATLAPDMAELRALGRSVIATAPADAAHVDFVSRFFAPSLGIDEDPVTGAAHCTLTPFWSRRLGKDELEARQISRRGGVLRCRDRGDRTEIAGRGVLVMRGELLLARDPAARRP
jgi:PhzF family phenazine biosynthesis protein